MTTTNFKLLDTVALIKDVPEKGLLKGQVGAIVEEWDEGVFEVEFTDKKGKDSTFFVAKVEDLMLLRFELSAA